MLPSQRRLTEPPEKAMVGVFAPIRAFQPVRAAEESREKEPAKSWQGNARQYAEQSHRVRASTPVSTRRRTQYGHYRRASRAGCTQRSSRQRARRRSAPERVARPWPHRSTCPGRRSRAAVHVRQIDVNEHASDLHAARARRIETVKHALLGSHDPSESRPALICVPRSAEKLQAVLRDHHGEDTEHDETP